MNDLLYLRDHEGEK